MVLVNCNSPGNNRFSFFIFYIQVFFVCKICVTVKSSSEHPTLPLLSFLLSYTHAHFFIGIYPAQYRHHPQSLYRDGCDPAVSGFRSSLMGCPSGNCCHVGSYTKAPLYCSDGCWTQLSSSGMGNHKIRFPLLDKGMA